MDNGLKLETPLTGFLTGSSKLRVNPKHVRSLEKTTANFFFFFPLDVTSFSPVWLSLPAPSTTPPPTPVCAAFVFMTTSVIRCHCEVVGVNTAEGNYSDGCYCFLPGSRLIFTSGSFCRSLWTQICAGTFSYTHKHSQGAIKQLRYLHLVNTARLTLAVKQKH